MLEFLETELNPDAVVLKFCLDMEQGSWENESRDQAIALLLSCIELIFVLTVKVDESVVFK